MDRDPLHDDVLEEALADRADLTGPAPLTPLSAAEGLAPHAGPTEPRRGPPPPLPVNWRPRMGPSGPPAPMPYNCTVETQTALNMVNWPLPSLTADDAGKTALVPVSISGRMGTEGDEEATDPLWQRHLGAMVLHHLSLAASAYVSAPALDTIRTWSGIRITLAPATPYDTLRLHRIDPQDLDNALHTGDLPRDDMDLDRWLDGADNIVSEWIEAGYEEESMESEDSTTDPEEAVHAQHAVGGADVMPATASSSSCIAPGRLSRSRSRSGGRSRSRSRASQAASPTRRDFTNHVCCHNVRRCFPNSLPNLIVLFSRLAGRTPVLDRQTGRQPRTAFSLCEAVCDYEGRRSSYGGLGPSPAHSTDPASTSVLAVIGFSLLDTRRRQTCVSSRSQQQSPLTCHCSCLPLYLQPDSSVTCPPCRYRTAGAACRCQACWYARSYTHILVPETHLLHPSVQICLVLSLILGVQALSVLLGLTVGTRHARSTATAGVCQAGWVVHQPLMHLWSPMFSLPGYRTDRAFQPASLTSIQRRSGPKSRGSRVYLLLHLLLLCHQLQPVTAAGSEARVVNPTTGFTEGVSALRPISDSAPKPSGVPPSSPMPSQAVSRYVKRSYRRACQRALRQGSTTYRGRLLEARQVPHHLRSPSSASIPQRPAPPAVRQGLRVFCWNAGGLGGGLYAELMTFLTNSQYDAAIILESKWQENMEYTAGPWSCIHSGCKSRKQAGVLILIHHRLAPPSQLRYEHILQGRLLHVRAPLPGKDHRHIHILGVYQKTYDPKCASMLEQRSQVWQALDRHLARIPVRDSLIAAGDYNTPLKPDPPLVGGVTCPMPCHPPEDLEDFSQLLRTYNLVALNTWRRHRPQAKASTFRFGDTESQIDFLLVKRSEATAQARRAHPLHGFHVGASRHGGAIHFPLVAMLLLRCPHWLRRPPQQQPRVSLDSLLSTLDHPTDPSHLSRIEAVRRMMSRHMAATLVSKG